MLDLAPMLEPEQMFDLAPMLELERLQKRIAQPTRKLVQPEPQEQLV